MSVFFIFVSVISFCLKTHPGFRVDFPATHTDHGSSSPSAVPHTPPVNIPSIPHQHNMPPVPPSAHIATTVTAAPGTRSGAVGNMSPPMHHGNGGFGGVNVSSASGINYTLAHTFKVTNYTTPGSVGNVSQPIATFSLKGSTIGSTTSRNRLKRSIRNVKDLIKEKLLGGVDHHGHGWHESYGQPHEAFFYVELVCNVWFFIEVLIRLIVSGCALRTVLRTV